MNMIKFFWYKHPKTGEMISDQRMVGYEDKPLMVKGVKCELDRDYEPPVEEHKPLGVIRVYKDGQREVWEADPGYVKKCNPKYVKYQDGHSERYNPNKHC
jgi:hypothetical protein